MRVAFFTRGDTLHGSSRVRVYQYLPHLRALGVESRVLPWGNRPRYRWPDYVTKAFALARWADVVVLQRPFQPTWLLDGVARINPNLVVDIDDAIWQPDGGGGCDAEIGRRLDHVANRARLVIVGSEYLASCMRERCRGADVTVLPGSLDPHAYPQRAHERRSPIVAGWVGGPGSLRDFDGHGDVLRALCEEGIISLRIICSQPLELPGVTSEFVPWSEATAAAEVARFDVGIMPLRDNLRTRGRCGYKAIEYMAAGLPVVATALPGPCDVIEDGRTGFLAGIADDWDGLLRRLAADHDARRRMGEAGRRLVVERYEVAGNAARLAALLGANSVRDDVRAA